MSGPLYEFTIPGIPRAQQRPRFARVGKFVRTYDPAQSRDYKALVQDYARQAGVQPIEGPVSICVEVEMPRPKRLCRKTDPDGPVPALCKPDVDNLYKIIADALTGVAYSDDSHVVKVWIGKNYHSKNALPRTRVAIDKA